MKTLYEISKQQSLRLELGEQVVAYPKHWQLPAATEKAAYESMIAKRFDADFLYVGAPWATMIDAIHSRSEVLNEILLGLNSIWRHLAQIKGGLRVVTVAQHIHVNRFMDIFRAVGITDIFWPHMVKNQTTIGGMKLHPFPLFPAQTANIVKAEVDVTRARRYLANFVGAYNPKIYLTDVRKHIFDLPNELGDLLIIERGHWHFDRAVYREQMRREDPSNTILLKEEEQREQYLSAIRDSYFTLCPTGSGPNSIRIGEALALNSIPIILTTSLALVGGQAGWSAACIIEDDSYEGLQRALNRARSMTSDQLLEMRKAGCTLYSRLRHDRWSSLITESMVPH